MKKHDENKDLRAFSRVGRVDYANKTLKAPKFALIGIRMWGRIDYLTHYCGWFFIWDNTAIGSKNIADNSDKKQEQRAAKKASKEHKLSDKTKKKK